jgi:hypothetical protein
MRTFLYARSRHSHKETLYIFASRIAIAIVVVTTSSSGYRRRQLLYLLDNLGQIPLHILATRVRHHFQFDAGVECQIRVGGICRWRFGRCLLLSPLSRTSRILGIRMNTNVPLDALLTNLSPHGRRSEDSRR